jgi:hypothetical protein
MAICPKQTSGEFGSFDDHSTLANLSVANLNQSLAVIGSVSAIH